MIYHPNDTRLGFLELCLKFDLFIMSKTLFFKNISSKPPFSYISYCKLQFQQLPSRPHQFTPQPYQSFSYIIYELLAFCSLFLLPLHISSYLAEPTTYLQTASPQPLPHQALSSFCQLLSKAQTHILPSFLSSLGKPSR